MVNSLIKNIKASDLLIKALENEEVEYIFGIPGEENLDFLESLRKSSKIKLILTRHEQAAGFMAATYGRLTGRPGVCLSTLGPGATNLVTAAAYAQLGAMPMVMITGQKAIKRSKQGRFQIVDVVSVMQPLTKFSKQIVNANTIPSLVREAFHLAQDERPGAVHLELPEDIAMEMATDTYLLPSNKPRRAIADQKAIELAIEMINNAKHPLLLVGAGANRKQIFEPLTSFIDKTGIPYFNTQLGKGVIGKLHPLFIGTAALSNNDYVHCAISKADLIINAGHDVIEKPPFFMKPNSAKVIHINFNPAEIDQVYFPQLEVIGDIGSTFKRLTEALSLNPKHDFKHFMQVRKEVQKSTHSHSKDPSYPLKPQRIVADVRKVIPPEGIVALDNGMYKIWFARNYPAMAPNTLLLDNALATMGAGLPSAMMASMLYPERRVIAVCGDGGFMMNSQELETAVRLGLNFVILVLRDDAYGMIRWKQEAMGFIDYGLQYSNPDFVEYANSYGIMGHRVIKTEDFLPIMEDAFKKGGVHLIEVPIDYSENTRLFIKELSRKGCQI